MAIIRVVPPELVSHFFQSAGIRPHYIDELDYTGKPATPVVYVFSTIDEGVEKVRLLLEQQYVTPAEAVELEHEIRHKSLHSDDTSELQHLLGIQTGYTMETSTVVFCLCTAKHCCKKKPHGFLVRRGPEVVYEVTSFSDAFNWCESITAPMAEDGAFYIPGMHALWLFQIMYSVFKGLPEESPDLEQVSCPSKDMVSIEMFDYRPLDHLVEKPLADDPVCFYVNPQTGGLTKMGGVAELAEFARIHAVRIPVNDT